jgi:N-acetylneuraminic acid mutarotase
MNKFYLYFLVVLFAFSCSEEDTQSNESKTILPALQTTQVQAVWVHEAIVTCRLIRLSTDSIKDHGFVYSTEGMPSLKRGTKISLGKISELKDFSHKLTGLEKSTLYYVRSYASTADSTVYGIQTTLTTKSVNEWFTYTVNGWPEFMIAAASAYGLTVNGKGYVGFGLAGNSSGTTVTPLYEFDPSSNTLTRLPDYPGEQTYYTRRFLLSGKIYTLIDKTFWRFDIAANTWKQMAAFPVKLAGMHTFILYGQAYVVGNNEDNRRAAEIWQYNEADDQWNLFSTVPPPNGPVPPDIHGVAVVDNKVYILIAYVTSNPRLYEYDPAKDAGKYTMLNTPPVTLPEGSVGNFGVASSKYAFFFLRDSGIIWQYKPEGDAWVKMDRPSPASLNPVIINDVIYLFGNSLYVYAIRE